MFGYRSSILSYVNDAWVPVGWYRARTDARVLLVGFARITARGPGAVDQREFGEGGNARVLVCGFVSGSVGSWYKSVAAGED